MSEFQNQDDEKNLDHIIILILNNPMDIISILYLESLDFFLDHTTDEYMSFVLISFNE